MSTPRLWLLFLVVVGVVVLALLPLRLVLPWFVDAGAMGVSASAVSGTVWRAHARDVAWQGASLGDLSLRLSPWPLLRGELDLQVDAATSSLVLVRGRRHGVRAASGTFPLPIEGMPRTPLLLELEGADALFIDGRCQVAGGHARARLQPQSPALAPLADLQLGARLACDGDDLLAAFEPVEAGRVSGTGLDSLRLRARLRGDGSYVLEVRAAPASAAMRLALAAAGFRPGPDGLALDLQGQLRLR